MNLLQQYQQKLRTADEAVKLVKDGDWVDYSQTCSFPTALDTALAARRDELRDVKIRNAISMSLRMPTRATARSLFSPMTVPPIRQPSPVWRAPMIWQF